MTEWESKNLEETFAALGSGEAGLSLEEARRRLREEGANALPAAKVDSVAAIFLRQFQSPLIYILLVAAVAVGILGEAIDAAIIVAVLFFNAIVGSIQEGRAQNTLLALRKFAETSATVLRDGREIVVPDHELVRGDVILLEEGEKIPADARLISAYALRVDEASLTGESEPVMKSSEQDDESQLVARPRSFLFKGTTIVAGHGKAVVLATGTRTVIGKIAVQISLLDAEIPLKTDIRRLSRALILVVGVVSASILALGLSQGQEFRVIAATVVSLAVSVIPEGLPVVITLVLATGVWRMSKRNVLVKKLQAVEALGQARIIAVDKTGTLTKNELVVREVWANEKVFNISGIGYEPKGTVELNGVVVAAANHPSLLFAGKLGTLCAGAHVSYLEEEDRWRVTGDPTEAATGVFGQKIGFLKDDVMRESPRLAEIPFDYKLKYHAVLHKETDGNRIFLEGAPEIVLDRCSHMYWDGEEAVLTEEQRKKLEDVLVEMSARGLRVVAGAVRKTTEEKLAPESFRDLTFVCFFGIQDVLRPEAADALKRAQAAGMRVVMITGDHSLTARAIAEEAGIWKKGDAVLLGAEIDALSDAELQEQIKDVTVFARVTPEHKLRIVNAYKARKEIIAMTGDGVNDAPPLVAADLGVAMGKIGTEVAKEAADIVLLDDNFGSIVSGVEEGRSIYKTLQKVMLYLFSTSLGEVFVIVWALLLGLPLPILAAQIIWLNFVTDGFLDVALAMEPKEEGLLSGSFKKPGSYIVDRVMIVRMVVMALPMMIGTLALFQYYYAGNIEKAWTISLTTLAAFQWFNAWNCRSEKRSVFQMKFFSNPFLVAATVIVIVLQIAAVYTPFLQGILRTVPLGFSDWVLIIPVAASIVFFEEIRKYIHRLIR